MKLSEIQQEFTYDVSCLIQYAYDVKGIKLTLGEAHRTNSQILLNYFGFKVVKGGMLGITLKRSIKLSKTLKSSHADRLAIDFNFFIDGRLVYDYEVIKPLGAYWTFLNPKNVWGGDFNKDGKKNGFIDTPHFQRLK